MEIYMGSIYQIIVGNCGISGVNHSVHLGISKLLVGKLGHITKPDFHYFPITGASLMVGSLWCSTHNTLVVCFTNGPAVILGFVLVFLNGQGK
jgi:hypothetical protein